MTLGLMPEKDARALLNYLSTQGEGADFCEEEIDLALELGGPHPFFLQIAGYHLYELPGRGEPQSPEAYDQVARRFNAEAKDHYRYLWSQLNADEQQALLSPNMAGEALRKTLLAKIFRNVALGNRTEQMTQFIRLGSQNNLGVLNTGCQIFFLFAFQAALLSPTSLLIRQRFNIRFGRHTCQSLRQKIIAGISVFDVYNIAQPAQ